MYRMSNTRRFSFLFYISSRFSPCEHLAMFPNTKIKNQKKKYIDLIKIEEKIMEGAGGCGGGHESI